MRTTTRRFPFEIPVADLAAALGSEAHALGPALKAARAAGMIRTRRARRGPVVAMTTEAARRLDLARGDDGGWYVRVGPPHRPGGFDPRDALARESWEIVAEAEGPPAAAVPERDPAPGGQGRPAEAEAEGGPRPAEDQPFRPEGAAGEAGGRVGAGTCATRNGVKRPAHAPTEFARWQPANFAGWRTVERARMALPVGK